MELIFLYPKFLLLFFLVPFFIFVYYLGMLFNKKRSMVFGNFEAIKRFYNIEVFSKNFKALYLNIILLVFLIFALSGAGLKFEADTSSFSYVIAIDSSESMTATDVSPNRFFVAKKEAKNFVDLLPAGVEMGVIGFAGDATIYHELDSNKVRTKMAIDNIQIGEISGTNVYNALLAANTLFGNKQAKAVILISDGQLNIRETAQIVRFINRNNLVVNTIAIGTDEGGIVERFGTVSTVDEDFLKALAFNSGGYFFRVTDLDGMRDSFESIFSQMNREVTIDLSMYFLIVSIGLLTLLWVMYTLRWKVVP
jgi:Ca-activated chloride channel homolog